ncbi:hypothetical protein LINPERHAP1_LOCUS31185, partial [Linum perenne]
CSFLVLRNVSWWVELTTTPTSRTKKSRHIIRNLEKCKPKTLYVENLRW